MRDTPQRLDQSLWRLVIRPLAEEKGGQVVCDTDAAELVERLLAVTTAIVHAVDPVDDFEELAPAYGERLVAHAAPGPAWEAATQCRLAVLDARRSLHDHVEGIRRIREQQRELPTVVVQGLEDDGALGPGASSLAVFGEHGWTVLELPGLPGARLVLPAGPRQGEGRAGALVTRLARSTALAPPPTVDLVPAQAHQPPDVALRSRLRDLEELAAAADARREGAERREAAAKDVTAALRTFHEQLRAEAVEARSRVKRSRLAEADATQRATDSERREEIAEAAAVELRTAHEHARVEVNETSALLEASRAAEQKAATRAEAAELRAGQAAAHADASATAEAEAAGRAAFVELRAADAERRMVEAEADADEARRLREEANHSSAQAAARLEVAYERADAAEQRAGALDREARRAADEMGIARIDTTALVNSRDALRSERDSLRSELAKLGGRRNALLVKVEALEGLQGQTKQDLERARASWAWRLGHALTKLGRILTFRRPGRTDALGAAIDRLSSPDGTR